MNVDFSRWPIAIVTPTNEETGTPTEEDIARFVAALSSILARRERYVQVTDAGRVSSGGDAKARAALTKWLKDNEALLNEYCVSLHLVVTSAIVRGAFTAIWWMSPPKMPHFLHSSRSEALAAAEDAAKKHGLVSRVSRA